MRTNPNIISDRIIYAISIAFMLSFSAVAEEEKSDFDFDSKCGFDFGELFKVKFLRLPDNNGPYKLAIDECFIQVKEIDGVPVKKDITLQFRFAAEGGKIQIPKIGEELVIECYEIIVFDGMPPRILKRFDDMFDGMELGSRVGWGKYHWIVGVNF